MSLMSITKIKLLENFHFPSGIYITVKFYKTQSLLVVSAHIKLKTRQIYSLYRSSILLRNGMSSSRNFVFSIFIPN